MLLHMIMFCWALLGFSAITATVVSLLTHKEAHKTQQPSSWLDFSEGQVEGERMQQILTKALYETVTDLEFERKFRAEVQGMTGLDTEVSWAWLGRVLMEYRQGSEFDASSRRLAERFLADVPRRYSLKIMPGEEGARNDPSH